MTSFKVVKNIPWVFIQKVPLAMSKCLSKWIQGDKWDYFHFENRKKKSANQFLLINYDLKIPSLEMACLLVI